MELNRIKTRLNGTSTEQKLEAILDALSHGKDGRELVAQMLRDSTREVRQSAFLMLSDFEDKETRHSLERHLLKREYACLYTFSEFTLDRSHDYHVDVMHPCYFAIADYNNTLFAYWDLTYRGSCINTWNLETGERKSDFQLNAHEVGLGKEGTVCVVSYQDLLWRLDRVCIKRYYQDSKHC